MAVKRVSNILTVVGATEAPDPVLVRIDADFADLSLKILSLDGTGATIGIDFLQQINPRLSLAYDGEKTAFTLGRRVKGATSFAEGIILKDTAGNPSTTGTLVLGSVSGRFQDNEVLKETSGSTPGTAVVNSATGGTIEYDNGVSVGAIAATTSSTTVRVDNTAVADALPPTKWHKMSITKGGTWTNATFEVDMITASI